MPLACRVDDQTGRKGASRSRTGTSTPAADSRVSKLACFVSSVEAAKKHFRRWAKKGVCERLLGRSQTAHDHERSDNAALGFFVIS